MLFFFFFNDPPTTDIYTLSLHDALPISRLTFTRLRPYSEVFDFAKFSARLRRGFEQRQRSEEHTSELQSRLHLVCRLLLEKKKNSHNQARGCSASRVLCRDAARRTIGSP